MDVRYINPFIASIKKVFSQMVRVDIKAGSPFLKNKTSDIEKLYTLSSTIDLSGTVKGKIILSMSEPVTLAVASGILSEQIKSIGEDCFDAIAEVTNMIAGGAKKEIATGSPISLSIPKVMLTKCLVYPELTPTLVIPFDTDMGRFVLQVSLLTPKPAPATPAAEAAPATTTPAAPPPEAPAAAA